MSTLHLLIKGKVQGVFYRATARDTAEKLGILGWIRNTADGNVEAVVCGPEDRLAEFIHWCKQGPPRARVTDVTITEQPAESFSAFEVRR